MTSRRLLAGSAAALVVAAALAGCSSGGSKGDATIVLVTDPAGGPQGAGPSVDAFKLAIADVNAGGGVDGRKLVADVIEASMDSATTSKILNHLSETKAVAGVAVGSSTPLGQLVNVLSKKGISTVAVSSPPAQLTAVEDKVWFVRPALDGVASREAAYAVRSIGKKVAPVCADTPFFKHECDAAALSVNAAAGVLVPPQLVATPTSDLGPIVAATKGADAIVAAGPDVLLTRLLEATAAAGQSMPILAGPSAGAAAAAPSVTGPARARLRGATDCLPNDPSRPQGPAFATKYKAATGHDADAAAAETYDAVTIIAAAMKARRPATAATVGTALATVRAVGVCADYKADESHALNRRVLFVSFNDDGSSKILATDG